MPTTAIRVPSFNAILVQLWSEMTEAAFAEFAAQHPLRAEFYRRMGRTGFSASDVQDAERRLQLTVDRMEASLRAGTWLIGDQFTLADISVIPTIVRMEDLGLAWMWKDRPSVADWYQRVQARPSFAAAYSGEARSLGSAAVCVVTP